MKIGAQPRPKKPDKPAPKPRPTITYVVNGVPYRLSPGQRLVLPKVDGGTITLVG